MNELDKTLSSVKELSELLQVMNSGVLWPASVFI